MSDHKPNTDRASAQRAARVARIATAKKAHEAIKKKHVKEDK